MLKSSILGIAVLGETFPFHLYWEVGLKILAIPVPGLELNPAHRPVDNYSYTVEGPTQSIPFARTTVWWGTGQRSEAQQLEPVLIFLGAPATQLARSPLLCFSCMAWCTILLTIFSIKLRVILRQPTRLTVSLFFLRN
jgi:hypothetical protein